jgi:diaminopimelate decarboxylase
MLSAWETHELLTLPERTGETYLTTVTGPTCMAFDQLTRRALPTSIQSGDHLIWLDAGAYHLSWETRFSHGLVEVLWHEGKTVKTVRPAETFKDWWGQWV